MRVIFGCVPGHRAQQEVEGVTGWVLPLPETAGQRLRAVMSPLDVVARISSPAVPSFLSALLTRPWLVPASRAAETPAAKALKHFEARCVFTGGRGAWRAPDAI